jgi:hypothetical protein
LVDKCGGRQVRNNPHEKHMMASVPVKYSPINAVPPMLLRITSPIRYGRGSTPKWYISITEGATKSIVVTLSKKACATTQSTCTVVP